MTLKSISKMKNIRGDIITVDWDTSNVTTLNHCFYNCPNLESVEIGDWDTSSATSLVSCFEDCHKLVELDSCYSDDSYCQNTYRVIIDTSDITSFEDVFNNIKATSLYIHKWDVSNVTDLTGCFKNCPELECIGIHHWDVSKVIDMSRCFYNCKRLKEVCLDEWCTQSLITMDQMFSECINLTKLDLATWDVSNLKSMESCFAGCTKLKYIDLDSWELPKNCNVRNCFKGCNNLQSIRCNKETFEILQHELPDECQLCCDDE